MPENKKNENPEEARLNIIQNPWRIFFWEAFLFSLTLVWGIFTGLRLGGFLVVKKVLPPIKITPPFPNLSNVQLPSSTPSFSLAEFLIYFLFTLLFIFFVIFVLKSKIIKKIIFKFLFILATGLGGTLALGVWFTGIERLFVIFFLIFLIIAWLTIKSVLIHDSLLILGIVGMGSAMGLRIDPWTGVIILIIFSVYDYIAVYKTKHMVRMAKEMTEQEAVLALIIPQKTSSFNANLKEVKPGGGNFLILGGGDMAFPLFLSVSLLPYGIVNSVIVAIFALIGFFVSFWIFINQKVRKPIPALPPIALFSIIGFLITLII